MTTPRTALVIGAGITGPVAAMALRKTGIQPTAYEAHPSGAEGIGTFLTIASNGIGALRAIGADETALAAGYPHPKPEHTRRSRRAGDRHDWADWW